MLRIPDLALVECVCLCVHVSVCVYLRLCVFTCGCVCVFTCGCVCAQVTGNEALLHRLTCVDPLAVLASGMQATVLTGCPLHAPNAPRNVRVCSCVCTVPCER